MATLPLFLAESKTTDFNLAAMVRAAHDADETRVLARNALVWETAFALLAGEAGEPVPGECRDLIAALHAAGNGWTAGVAIGQLTLARYMFPGEFSEPVTSDDETRRNERVTRRVRRAVDALLAWQAAAGFSLVRVEAGGAARQGNQSSVWHLPLLAVMVAASESARGNPRWRYRSARREVLEAELRPRLAALGHGTTPDRTDRPGTRRGGGDSAGKRVRTAVAHMRAAARISPERAAVYDALARAAQLAGGTAGAIADPDAEARALAAGVVAALDRLANVGGPGVFETFLDAFKTREKPSRLPSGGFANSCEISTSGGPHRTICPVGSVENINGADDLPERYNPPAPGGCIPYSSFIPYTEEAEIPVPDPEARDVHATAALEVLATWGVERIGVVGLNDIAPEGERRKYWRTYAVGEAAANQAALLRLSTRDGLSVALRYSGRDFGGQHGIVHVEDAPAGVVAALLDVAGLVVETSPGSHHVLIGVTDSGGRPLDDAETRETQRRLAARFASDGANEGARGAFRLPGTDNRKPSHARPDGTFPMVQTVWARPGFRVRLADLEMAGLLAPRAPRPPERRRRARATIPAPGDWPDVREIEWRTPEAPGGKYAGQADPARVAFRAAYAALRRGFGEAEVEAWIEREIPWAAKADRARKAVRAAARKGADRPDPYREIRRAMVAVNRARREAARVSQPTPVEYCDRCGRIAEDCLC